MSSESLDFKGFYPFLLCSYTQDIEMIAFPDEFLKNEPVISGVIDNPRATIFSAYKTNLENIADIFQKREISEQLRCLSHSRKTVN